jgi:hypothetical protein
MYKLTPGLSRWERSDRWFKLLEQKTLPYLQTLRVNQAPQQPIRIAILDTGIDAKRVGALKEKIQAEHPGLKAHSHRVKKLRTWIADEIFGTEPDEMRDMHGHGTHASSLILKVAPYAELFVAQINREGDIFEPNPISVAQVHAFRLFALLSITN